MRGIIDDISSICRADEDSQKAVKAKIKGYKCGYAAKRSLKMGGGMVIYMGNNVEGNRDEWATKWLKKNL